MPTYDYQCRSCGAVIEVFHAMTDDGPSVCEVCGGSLRRVLYPAGIIFKGSGFYRTDSRASSTSSAPSTSSDAKPKASDSGGSGSGGSAKDSTPSSGSGSGASSGSTSGSESAA